MANFKVIHFFQNDEQSLGWSEVYYCSAADIVAAQTASLRLAQERVKLLCSPIELKYSRVSGNDQPGTPGTHRQRLASLQSVLLTGSFSPTTDYPDVSWTAAKVRLQNADGTIFRVQLLRGLPDIFWDQGTDKLAKQNMKVFVKGWKAALVAGNFQIRHIIRGNPVRSYIAIHDAQFEGLTRRATGRPSYLPRGRRSKR